MRHNKTINPTIRRNDIMRNLTKTRLHRKALAAVCLLGCLCSACSSAKPAAGHPSTNTANPLVTTPGTASASPTPQQTLPPATPSPTPVPTTSAAFEPKTVKVEYRLNKNFDVVPIEANGNKKVVLLTFDDGPKDLDLNEKLLAALDKHKAKAIFFVNGYRVKKKPELLKLIHSKGQMIGNHSWDHIDLKLEKPEKVDQQIRDVQAIVNETIGEAPVFFRPPYGSSGDYVKQRAKEEKMLFMTWSNGSEDWVEKYQNPQAVIKRVLEQLHYGSNILMHELPWTTEALDDLLTQLEEKGYTFVDPRSIEIESAP
jgi:peptidoglycan/xylan/chitin deacetylase (PgdA/CDA1 family)